MSDIPAFDDAQTRAIAMLDEVLGAVEAGMTRHDVAALAASRLDAHGFDRWMHEPLVDVGCEHGLLSRARARLGGRRKVEPGVLVRIDLGPADARAFGDVGVTWSFGSEKEPTLVKQAREVVRATAGYASRWKTVGELYIFARAWANNRQLQVDGEVAGHACLGPEGMVATGWPRSAHAATLLRRNQVRMLNPTRIRGIWALQIPLTDGKQFAVFEEMISVTEDERKVLGRGGPEHGGVYVSLRTKPGKPPAMRGERDH